MSDLIGATLGPYRILEQIGRGGMATVYKAYHPATDRYVAVKILPLELADDPSFVVRFEREAKIVASLQHVHILPVFDYGQQGTVTYLVMPYVPTGTLKNYLAASHPGLQETARLFCQIADAVDYAHQKGVLHRDIKPANILLDDSGNALLTDFGLARMTQSVVSLTGSGGIIGTPSYMSPEQGQGLELDARSDIYSLGVVLYEMVVGEVPYSADTPVAVILKHVNQPLPLPRATWPDIPEAVERVILKALAKDPVDRFQTAGEMAEALRKAVSSAPPTETQQETRTNTAQGRKTRPVIVAADAQTQPSPRQAEHRQRFRWLMVAGIGLVLVAITVAVLASLMSPPTMIPSDTPSLAVIAAVGTESPTPATPIAQALRSIAARDGPSAEFPVVATLEANERLDIVGISEDGGWYQVLLPDGSLGWVAASAALISTSGDLQVVPIAQAPTELPTLADTPTDIPTVTPSSSPTMTPDVLGTADAQSALDTRATLDTQATAAQDTLNFQVTMTQIVIDLTATATLWTPTPTTSPTAMFTSTSTFTVAPTRTPLPIPASTRVAGEVLPLENIGSPPPNALEVVRCDSAEGGTGLCIKPLVVGGQFTRLVESPDFNPEQFPSGYTWSPDGNQIVFSARMGSAEWSRLYLINSDGSGLVERSGRYNPIEPSWSPDGQWWAFHDGNSLAVMRPDGTDHMILYPGHCVENPQWSPDSRMIVFSESETTIPRCPHNPPHTRLIIVASLDGTFHTLATTVHESACMDLRVAFSPDGRQIAYIDGQCRGMLVNADGSGEPMRISEFPQWWTSWVYPQWGGTTLTEISPLPFQLEPPPPSGRILYVDANANIASNNEGDGTQASPFNTIQDAIDFASDGDAIHVAAGIYDENLVIRRKRLMIEGGYAPTTWERPHTPEATVIDGGQRAPVLWITDGAHVAISGFTVQDGYNLCDNSVQGGGGGFAINGQQTEVTIARTVIRDNRAEPPCGGGGIETNDSARVTVVNSLIVHNTANDGGGIGIFDSQTLVINTTITANLPDGINIGGQRLRAFVMNSIFWDNGGRDIHPDAEVVNSMVAVSPHFVDPDVGDFHLRPDSPAVDDGIADGAPPIDLEGRPRPAGAGVDIGAYEFQPMAGAAPVIEGVRLDVCEGNLCIFSPQGTTPLPGLTANAYDGFSWSPDGTRFVFGACRGTPAVPCWWDIYVANRDGTDITSLTGDPAPDSHSPAWSPDGEWIAYYDGAQLRLIRPDGTDGHTIMEDISRCPPAIAWSPDSQRLAWLAQNCRGNDPPHSVWVMERDGTGVRPIFEPDTPQFVWDSLIAWNPEGTHVAVTRLQGDAYLIDANCPSLPNGCDESSRTVIEAIPQEWQHNYYPHWGRAAQTEISPPIDTVMENSGELVNCDDDLCFVNNQGEPTRMGFSDRYTIIISPSWSQDGSRFVFSACPLENYNNGDCSNSLFIANRDGSEVTPLVSDPTANNSYPAWSPDGEWIAYIPNGALVLVRPDGSELRTLLPVNSDYWAEGLAWSPDGQRIAWQGGDCRHCRSAEGRLDVDGVWVMNRDGTQMQELFRSPDIPLIPNRIAWSPDGNSIAVTTKLGANLLIDANCPTLPGGCNEALPTPVEVIPEVWFSNYYPQWGRP